MEENSNELESHLDRMITEDIPIVEIPDQIQVGSLDTGGIPLRSYDFSFAYRSLNKEKEIDKVKKNRESLCSHCERYSQECELYKMIDGKVYCKDCFFDNNGLFQKCAMCNNRELKETMLSTIMGFICHDHTNNFFKCSRCSVYVLSNTTILVGNKIVCMECSTEEENSIYYQHNGSQNMYRKCIPESKKTKSDDFGKIINSKRGFAVEIECHYPNEESLFKVASTIPLSVGISGDGSLNGRGVELQTPVLIGTKGEDTLEHICRQLVNNNFDVGTDCGTHIHLSSNDYLKDPRSMKYLWLFYMTFEDVIMSFLPMARRKNRYCQPIKSKKSYLDVMNISSRFDLEKLWYNVSTRKEIKENKKTHYNSTRYTGINFHSLLSNGHIEIRYHSGTLNYKKMLMWAWIHIRILDYIKESRITGSSLQKAEECIDLKEKTKLFYKVLNFEKDVIEYLNDRQEKFLSPTGTQYESHLKLSTKDLKAKRDSSCVV